MCGLTDSFRGKDEQGRKKVKIVGIMEYGEEKSGEEEESEKITD